MGGTIILSEGESLIENELHIQRIGTKELSVSEDENSIICRIDDVVVESKITVSTDDLLLKDAASFSDEFAAS